MQNSLHYKGFILQDLGTLVNLCTALIIQTAGSKSSDVIQSILAFANGQRGPTVWFQCAVVDDEWLRA